MSHPVSADHEGGAPLTERATTAAHAIHGTRAQTEGEKAERLVVDRLRAVLPPEVAVLHHVRWMLRDRGYEREGEADVVIGDPDRGFLVLEVKAGEIQRDAHGRWCAGDRLLARPVRAGRDSLHALVAQAPRPARLACRPQPDRRPGRRLPRRRARPMRRHVSVSLGPDVDPDLIADQSTSSTDGRGRASCAPSSSGRSSSGAAGRNAGAGPEGIDLLARRSPSRSSCSRCSAIEIAAASARSSPDRGASTACCNSFGRNGAPRSSAARGPARRCSRPRRRGSSPSEGFERSSSASTRRSPRCWPTRPGRGGRGATGHLTVKTFHQLCEDLGREAGMLPPRSRPGPAGVVGPDAADALDEAVEQLGPRYHAIVVDEGQDFDAGVARVARGAAVRWPGRRAVRLPRPGAGDLSATTWSSSSDCRPIRSRQLPQRRSRSMPSSPRLRRAAS